ncbi:hypothetical protein NM688_g3910 [Phlebia brevispora]|uniref:Uncharacterized protein n=1 Tax=Phlebia brevispora TaxID=194682 RepID=A0ACC1T4D1_9APHY|nr:hypothetical protein NM688_g3910 [Phlebia brevispora]
MVRSTILVRASDALPLAATVDDEQVRRTLLNHAAYALTCQIQTEQSLQEHKQQAKLIFRRITPNSEPRCSIESGQYTLHYLIADNVVYLVIADKSYPRKLAFSYLDELSKEFATSYGAKVETVRKPYAFVGFDTFMSKTTRLYQDTRNVGGGSSLDKLNDELHDVTRIMTKNMEELLWRGDSLDRMSHLSTSLRSESEKYRKATRNINLQAMLRQYAPIGAVVLLFIILLYWRFCHLPRFGVMRVCLFALRMGRVDAVMGDPAVDMRIIVLTLRDNISKHQRSITLLSRTNHRIYSQGSDPLPSLLTTSSSPRHPGSSSTKSLSQPCYSVGGATPPIQRAHTPVAAPTQGQIQPGSVTYTTTTGPDGQVIYHCFKAVPARYDPVRVCTMDT